jgi:DNA mismatch endonuclease (patch repair protein)
MDTLSAERRSWNMGQIKGKNTRPELVVRSLLHAAGYRFRLHGKLPGKPDIVLKKYKAVIFVHGCFWHRHPGCKFAYTPKTRVAFWTDKFQKNIERDEHHTEALLASGWLPVTIWECDIKADPGQVLAQVVQLLENRLIEQSTDVKRGTQG